MTKVEKIPNEEVDTFLKDIQEANKGNKRHSIVYISMATIYWFADNWFKHLT